jgi:hypothetical protein
MNAAALDQTRPDILPYRTIRRDYEPAVGNRKVIFVFESPPKTGAYFYDAADNDGKRNVLFNAMMQEIVGWPKQSRRPKAEGLRQFADAGYLLLDATYEPINGLSGSVKNAIMERDLPILIGELDEYAEPGTKIVVGKVNVCQFLVPELKKWGRFVVLNGAEGVRLPITGNQSHFGTMVRPMLGLPEKVKS